MLLFVFTFFAQCLIPEYFRPLAEKAILNSTTKVAKSSREDTKYPANYTIGNVHFTLYKILSSSKTTDIKGYAIEKNYAAIVKRKKFNLTDGFTLIDLKNQEFYVMEKIVAFDDKINIYKIIPVDIFHVFSDIEAKIQTSLNTQSYSYLWDQNRDRPELHKLDICSVGAGALFSLTANAKVKFKSLKKAEINTYVTITGKIGAEFVAQKGDYDLPDQKQFPDADFLHRPSISFSFLGLNFYFGLYMSFNSMIKDLRKKLEVDIDYYKSYQLTAKRFICIKRHGTLDSGWQITYSPIPERSIVSDEAINLESNYITATYQLKTGFKLKAEIFGLFNTSLSFGLLNQFKINFGYFPIACPYPYLYGQFELPIFSFFDFYGIFLNIRLFGTKKKYTLLKPEYKEMSQISHIKTSKYCIYDTSNISDYDILADIVNDNESSYETAKRIISVDIKNLVNLAQTNTFISLQLSLSEINTSTNTEIKVFERRASPFEDIYSKSSSYETTLVEDGQKLDTSNLLFYFWYLTDSNVIEKSQIYSFLLKEYVNKNDSYAQCTISNSLNTETISFDLRIKYCEIYPLHKMYVPLLSLTVLENSLNFGDKICIIVKNLNENTEDYVDEYATFLTDGTFTQSMEDQGTYTHKDEFFRIRFDNITLPSNPDSEKYVHYEIAAEYGENYHRKTLLINNFSKSLHQDINVLSDDFKPKLRFTNDMRLSIQITYIHDNDTILLHQLITFDEIQKIGESENFTIIKRQPNTKISCGIFVERYKPLIRINCSKPNSTHRIITRVYTLDSVKPSEYKPIIICFEEDQSYGVFELTKIHKNINVVIIHMPHMQPLCKFTMLSNDYYQFSFDKDVIYIPFRRQNSTMANVTIENVIQGSLIDENPIFYSQAFYTVDFDKIPVAIAFVRTINNQYSVTGIEGTKQTLVNYSDPYFQLLALEYEKDKTIFVSSSLIIIDDNHPLAEMKIPKIPYMSTVTVHVWCERADEIVVHDKTSQITTEQNTEKEGNFYKLTVATDHLIYFIPICAKNSSHPMCYIKQEFADHKGYAIIRYQTKMGSTILNTSLDNLFEQEDRQGLIEEAIKIDKSFYYMTSSSDQIQIIRTYENQLDLQLRVIEVQNMYKKFCIVDPDGFIVPVSRNYYSNHYNKLMIEYGIQYTDPKYLDFVSGMFDSCIYATYNSSNYSDYQYGDYNDTDYSSTYFAYIDMSWDSEMNDNSNLRLLNDYSEPILNPSNNICDLAKSIKVSYYKDIKQLIPPASFDHEICKYQKIFEDNLIDNIKLLNYEIYEYFVKAKMVVVPKTNKSIYVLDLPFKEINFTTKLNTDEYINIKDNFTIHYLGGKLNCLTPENTHTIIDLGNANEMNLSLIGKGSLEIKTNGKSTLKIKGKLNIDSRKTIFVDDQVKLVEIENVIFANYAELNVRNSLNDRVNFSINNLTLLEHSIVNLTNLEITETLVIKQTATAIFDKTVTIKKANLFIEMIVYQNDLIPMIRGTLIEPPKAIYIQRISNDAPKNKDEYMIFDGQFDCQSWFDRMKFDNSHFNTVRCARHKNNAIRNYETEESRAFVSFDRESIKLIKEKYITFGLIVILILVFIDILLFIIIISILIKKKNKSKGNDYDSRSNQSSSMLDHHFENDI